MRAGPGGGAFFGESARRAVGRSLPGSSPGLVKRGKAGMIVPSLASLAGLGAIGAGRRLEDLGRAEQAGLGFGKAGEPRIGLPEEALNLPEPPVPGGTIALLDLERVTEQRLRGGGAALGEVDAGEAQLLAGDGRMVRTQGRPGDRQGFFVARRRLGELALVPQ